MKVEVELSDMIERKADSKGRVAVGPDKAGKKVTLAVVEVEEPDE
jgi:hypothetical protein